MRTFIAIKFPPDILTKIDQITSFLTQQTSQAHLKWVKPDNLHLTIKFIGEIHNDTLNSIKEIISETLKRSTTFDISIKGLGMFPNQNQPRVVWLGILNSQPLSEIHSMLDQALQAVNILSSSQKYSPHLTIARIHRQATPEDARKIGQILANYQVHSLGTFTIDKIHLYRSDLRPEGPLYTPLMIVPLNKV